MGSGQSSNSDGASTSSSTSNTSSSNSSSGSASGSAAHKEPSGFWSSVTSGWGSDSEELSAGWLWREDDGRGEELRAYVDDDDDDDSDLESGSGSGRRRRKHGHSSYNDVADDEEYYRDDDDDATATFGGKRCAFNVRKCVALGVVMVALMLSMAAIGASSAFMLINADHRHEDDTIMHIVEDEGDLVRMVQALHGAVAADDLQCSQAGVAIMQHHDGNAVDAAVAVSLCSGLVHPWSNGIGGGFVMLYALATTTESDIKRQLLNASPSPTNERLAQVATRRRQRDGGRCS